ncbi:hypothetical protein L1049_023429 [Liquidambar formosana]|uniref:Uncharacterized protein n=1 Tax=Liquidambar formosana TaxID=63359 RepID=A0AAP0X430_LIQFO
MKRTNFRTHQSTDRTREELTAREWGLVQVADTNPGFQSGRKNILDVEEQLRQERLKQTPWLFQFIVYVLDESEGCIVWEQRSEVVQKDIKKFENSFYFV